MTIRLIEGLRCRLRNLPRLLVWVKGTCSPSYSNHIGLIWTVSSGRIVPRAAKIGRSSSGRCEAGIVALMSSERLEGEIEHLEPAGCGHEDAGCEAPSGDRPLGGGSGGGGCGER